MSAPHISTPHIGTPHSSTPHSSMFRTVELSDPAIPADGLRFATVKSRALGRRADVTLYRTPGADAAGDLPVVILLHGVYGSHWAWALKGDAHRTAARLVAQGALPPLALLMPSDGLWGDGSGYLPHRAADGGITDYARWILDEVPALARETVAGCGPRSPLLLAGLSMGGYGALRLAAMHPHRIAAAAAHSAVTEPAQFDALVEDDRVAWDTAPGDGGVLAALRAAPGPLPPLRFDCGRDDPYLASNRALHAALEAGGIAHEYAERDGGHDWPYWTAALEDTLRFFGRALDRTRGEHEQHGEHDR